MKLFLQKKVLTRLLYYRLTNIMVEQIYYKGQYMGLRPGT